MRRARRSAGVRALARSLLPLLEGLLAGARDEGDEEVLLGLEVAVDDGLGDAGGLGELGGGGPRVALLAEDVGGAVEQLLASLGCGETAHGLPSLGRAARAA
jgi:hypothetical protein